MTKLTKDVSKWEVGGVPILGLAWTIYETLDLQSMGVDPEQVPRVIFIIAALLMLARVGQQKWHAKKAAE